MSATFQDMSELIQLLKRPQTDMFDLFKHFKDNSWQKRNATERGQFIRLIVSKIELTDDSLAPSNAIWRIEMLKRLVTRLCFCTCAEKERAMKWYQSAKLQLAGICLLYSTNQQSYKLRTH